MCHTGGGSENAFHYDKLSTLDKFHFGKSLTTASGSCAEYMTAYDSQRPGHNMPSPSFTSSYYQQLDKI